MLKFFSITIFLLSNQLLLAETAVPSFCGNNEESRLMAELITQHVKQHRPALRCSQNLSQIALLKAQLLTKERDISHTAGHTTPNHLLRKNGYNLSKRYPILGNQVEAIAGGEHDPTVAFQDFLNSEPHRVLLLGEHDYFLEQNDIGIAYLYDKETPYEHYWVILFGDQDKATTAVNIHKEFILSPIKK